MRHEKQNLLSRAEERPQNRFFERLSGIIEKNSLPRFRWIISSLDSLAFPSLPTLNQSQVRTIVMSRFISS